MHPLQQLLATFSTSGKQFEVLCKWILENDPIYANKLTDVWMWSDWEDRWSNKDLGIDLVAKDTEGKIWAIQAKHYKSDHYISKPDIDSFLSWSGNDKIDVRLLIGTTDRIGPNAIESIQQSHTLRPVHQLLLTELLEKQLSWPKSYEDLSPAVIKKPFKPKQHQQNAIDDVVTGFAKHDRGQMIMACGTGKTLAGLWIAEKLKAETTLILFPSLLLLSSTLTDWLRHSSEPFRFLPVCSDDSAAKSADDAINFKTSDLSFPSTTNEAEIAEFLKKDGKKVIFSTYQSSPQIAAAYKVANLKPLDLIISDEAHRCAGKAGAVYTTALDNNQIPSVKRLFMTATPKIFQTHIKKAAEESGVEVLSMDDAALFGPVVHKLPFGDAIEQDLLSDYQVVVVGVDDSLCAEMISERRFIQTENEIETDAQSFASHIGLAKAIKSYDLRRVITFHSKVKSAKDFQEDFPNVVEWMPEESQPDGDFVTNYVSGAMSTSDRNQNLRRLGELEDGERAILSNARCLSEGVDVPALDGVAFIDPRNSEIDIVQAVGRAIRLSSGKTVGTIVIPVFIAEHEDPDEVLNDSVFKKVWAVVNALRSHDEGLGIELDNFRRVLGKRGSIGLSDKIHFDLPTRVSAEFEQALSVKLIESTTAPWEYWFGLLETYKAEHGDCLVPTYFKSGNFSLGFWVATQRGLTGILAPERVQRLDDLGFIWDVNARIWEEGFAHLKAYKKANGSCLVSSTFKSGRFALGSWVSTQRKNKKILPTENIQRLDALGFIWDANAEKMERGIAYLTTYKEEHGNCLVPSSFKFNEFPLGNWVANHRKKKEMLAPDILRRLNDLGFEWGISRNAKWEEGFSYLKAYKKEHQDCSVIAGSKYDGFPLGSWVSYQRMNREKLSSENIQRLDDLDFVWGRLDHLWEEGFENLVTYKEKFGNCKVEHKYKINNHALGRWVSSQRQKKEKLTSENIQRLDDLGFVWDPVGQEWEEGFETLVTYKGKFGHCRVESNYKIDDYNLGAWAGYQRTKKIKGSLEPEKIERLEEIEFVWDIEEYNWEEGFSHLKKYKKEHGDCLAPHSIKFDGFALGTWIARQRARKGKLTSGKIQRLDDLGFVWSVRSLQWEEGFTKLKAYKEEHGDCLVSNDFNTSEGFRLGGWVMQQKTARVKGQLTSERSQRLDELGFFWRIKK